MDKQAMQQQALQNATHNASMVNYPAIIQGFMEKGIAAADIQPRINVFTFNAWKALGRTVKRGEHGVKVCTWIPMSKKDSDGNPQPIGRKPRMTTVFHVSQTDEIQGASAEKAVIMEQSRDAARSINAQVCEMQHKQAESYYSDEFTAIK